MALKPPPFPAQAARGPTAGDLALQGAAAALQAGRPAEAERIAAQVLTGNAGNVAAMQILGAALLMQGRGKEAIAPLERAARQSRDAASDTRLAMALRQAGREEEARERFERALKRKPPFPPAFLELASLLTARKQYDEAIDILQQGLAAAPQFADLSLQLGRVYAERGHNAEAREALTRAVSVAPRHPDALFMLGRALQAERDFAGAAETYRRLLTVTPKDAAAEIGLGICLIELGRKDEGLRHLRAASRTSAKMYGEAIAALIDAGRGRFWIRPSDAARALRDGND